MQLNCSSDGIWTESFLRLFWNFDRETSLGLWNPKEVSYGILGSFMETSLGLLNLTKAPKKENRLRRSFKVNAADVYRQTAAVCEGSIPEAGSGPCCLVLSHGRSGRGGYTCVRAQQSFFSRGSRLRSNAFVSVTDMRKLICSCAAARTGRRQLWNHLQIQNRSSTTVLWDLFSKLGLGLTTAKSLWLALGEYQLAADEDSHLAN